MPASLMPAGSGQPGAAHPHLASSQTNFTDRMLEALVKYQALESGKTALPSSPATPFPAALSGRLRQGPDEGAKGLLISPPWI